jgi:hypothetical protein
VSTVADTLRRRPAAERLREAGELLAVEAIDRTGLIVTSEGALVRIFRVQPRNPLLMSADEQAHTAAAFQRLVGQLRAHETLQIYLDARPVNLDELLAHGRQDAHAAPEGEDGNAREDRLRLHAALEESLRRHGDEHAAVQFRAHVVVPLHPRTQNPRAALAWSRGRRGPTAPLERSLRAHRRAVREHLAHVDALRAELEADGMGTRLLDGREVTALLWARFNPTAADHGRGPVAASGIELLGELDAVRERDEARAAAQRLRAAIARSSLDFNASHQRVTVDEDLEQTIAAHTTAGRTHMGWLHAAMLTRQPYTLSVYVRALDRRRERQRLKLAYRRLFTINRGAEQRGRVPDFDRYLQEREYEGLLGELAGGQQAGIYRVAIYQTLRVRGPHPDPAALTEAVDYCAEQIEAVGDCKVARGEFRQHELWISGLPLGRDHYARARKYPTANTGDMVPLVGTQCGSPTGVPFAFADPGRTVERLNPYDPEHANHTLVIAGKSGSGKTLAANTLLSRCLAHGARAFVIDRAGHYEMLTRLLAGAQQIELGADDSPYALNPWDVPDCARVSREKVAFLLALHQLMMGGLDARETGLLGAAVRAVYAKAAALPGSRACESMLREELLAEAADALRADAADVAATLRNLADRLAEYCGDGTYAYLLDRRSTVPEDAPLVVFDTRRCPDSELALVMFSILEYVTGTVARHWHTHCTGHSRAGSLFAGRSIMLIDEAWHLINRPETGAYANTLARRARHLGLNLIVMSQQLSDFDTEHGVALLGNSSQQLLLSQNPKEIPFIRDALQLTDREAAELERLKTVKGRHAQMLWLNGTRGHGRVALRVGPTEYWAFTSEPTEAALRDEALARHPGDPWAALAELAGPHAASRAATIDPAAGP